VVVDHVIKQGIGWIETLGTTALLAALDVAVYMVNLLAVAMSFCRHYDLKAALVQNDNGTT
jgi:hypothetical protein